ncbi:MAG: hypothetical protein A2287_05060 [Candidatus Melainabacteria bacterium RIFOXYA12_FULL_32_12]|nr:MAG: hypothetical protein A2255_00610 [Candidatus Melainabacteria bacterium RIFOXYA2_FULL_32_9]OGI28863.1 MAG: hypothetical protein A2287_05060 [Candidatus Melainabacteria bacterium RIFOXYA12_FULL_32_12]
MRKIIVFILGLFLMVSSNAYAEKPSNLAENVKTIKNNKKQVKKNSKSNAPKRSGARKSKSCNLQNGKLTGCGH